MNEATLRAYGFRFCQDWKPICYFIIIADVPLPLEDALSLSVRPFLEDAEAGESPRASPDGRLQIKPRFCRAAALKDAYEVCPRMARSPPSRETAALLCLGNLL